MLSLSERFGMADSASNFNGALFNLLEYSADTEIAEQILVGTFVPPLGTPASKIATIDEIGRIWKEMGKGEAEIVVSQDDFQYYWKSVRSARFGGGGGVCLFSEKKSKLLIDSASDFSNRELLLVQ